MGHVAHPAEVPVPWRCKLVVNHPGGRATEFTFDQPTVTLGALHDNDVALDDDRVSRCHARIFLEGDSFLIADLRSLTGTHVDGVRVREAWLRSGCTITLGATRIQFSLLTPLRAPHAPRPIPVAGLIGESDAMQRLRAAVAKVAPTAATVVLEGETGTGKEVAARALHQLSPRAGQPFVVVDCSAVAPNLLESELFGHERGSFTGALATRAGLFEHAQGGTVFLDEVGELPLDLQPKLLRALETREIRRVGSNRSIAIDVRVVAATNRDLAAEVQAGRFRQDLFYRLGVVQLRLPPLRERPEDIGILIDHILRTAAFNRPFPDDDPAAGPRIKRVSHAALQVLHTYGWPGNVRELGNILERACSFAEGDLLQVDDLPESIRGAVQARPRSDAWMPTAPLRSVAAARAVAPAWIGGNFAQAKELCLATFERDYLAGQLAHHGGNLSQAARAAELDRKHFRRLARKHHLIPGTAADDATEEGNEQS